MFTLNYMSGEELEQANDAYKAFPLFRPSHYVANILERDNVLTVGPTVEWMMRRRGPFSGSGYRKIAIPVEPSECDRWFHDSIVNAAWRFSDGYIAFVNNELYVIGNKNYHAYPFETSSTEAFVILGKVTVGSRFTPMVVPNFGLVIRALTPHDIAQMSTKSNRAKPNDSFDYDSIESCEIDEEPIVQYNWTVFLVPKEGVPHPTDYIEGYQEVMKKMDLNPSPDVSLGKLLQHWEYPMQTREGNVVELKNGKLRMEAGSSYTPFRAWDMEWEEGSGVVELIHRRDGETSTLLCYPGLELPFVKSFK